MPAVNLEVINYTYKMNLIVLVLAKTRDVLLSVALCDIHIVFVTVTSKIAIFRVPLVWLARA